MGNKMCRPELKLLHERGQVLGIGYSRIIVRRRPVFAWEVIAPAVIENALVLAEGLQFRFPHPVIIQRAVHEHDGVALATFQIMQLDAVDPNGSHLARLRAGGRHANRCGDDDREQLCRIHHPEINPKPPDRLHHHASPAVALTKEDLFPVATRELPPVATDREWS